jgi:hypothetical protein
LYDILGGVALPLCCAQSWALGECPDAIGNIANGISAPNVLCPVHELWDQAYEELRKQEDKLIKDYEAVLTGDLAIMIGSMAVMLSGSKEERKDQMATLLTRKIEEVKKNTWKLKFGGQDIPLKDLAQPVVGIIQWADDYISGALSSNPYASLAWGGVSLLLPVSHFLNYQNMLLPMLLIVHEHYTNI